MCLTSQQIIPGLGGSFNLHATYSHRVVIPLYRPRDFHGAPAGGPDHEPHRIGIGCCGTQAAASGISEVAATPQSVHFDDCRSVHRAVPAIEITQWRGHRTQLSQRRGRDEKWAGHRL